MFVTLYCKKKMALCLIISWYHK